MRAAIRRRPGTWLVGAGADGKPATIVDYIPLYASPIGAAFAYWLSVR